MSTSSARSFTKNCRKRSKPVPCLCFADDFTVSFSLEEGYQSVRKWTSKFDFFDKKYIIVPINEQ